VSAQPKGLARRTGPQRRGMLKPEPRGLKRRARTPAGGLAVPDEPTQDSPSAKDTKSR
jgi:hypothetical protein